MSEIKKVKIQSIIESQIPEFLNAESPIFNEFLKQYYISQEYQTGLSDLSRDIPYLKNVEIFNDENFYTQNNPCTLSSDIFIFSTTINVNSTFGFPDSYGLLKIDNEIITYTSKTASSFEGCVRGFSGISLDDNDKNLYFSSTEASTHTSGTVVKNLSLDFYKVFFNNFKKQFFPGFEDRNFTSQAKIKNILLEARDFYTTKGTDISFKILFSILFSENVDVISPQDYTLSPSSNEYIITRNILVEQVIRNTETKSLSSGLINELKGKTIFQNVYGSTTEQVSSASIYNIEYRPFETIDLFEISLDSTSFLLDFQATKKTKVLENVSQNATSLLVDSTVGFGKTGDLLIKTNNLNYPIKVSYTDKSINQFNGVAGIVDSISSGTDVLEENFLYTYLNDGTKIEFRLINLIDNVDLEKSSNLRVGDKVALSKFGMDLNDNFILNKWIHNITTKQDISKIENDGTSLLIRLVNQEISFNVGDSVELIDTFNGNSTTVSVIGSDEDLNGKYVRIPIIQNPNQYNLLRKKVKKASSNLNYFPSIVDIPSGVQNTYVDYDLNHFYVASTGLPDYTIFSKDSKKFVNVSVANTDTIFSPNHNLFTGEKIYYFGVSSSGISTGTYVVKRQDQNNIKLSFSNNDLIIGEYLSFTSAVPSQTDYFVKYGYEDPLTGGVRQLKNQKLFKKFLLIQPHSKTFLLFYH